MTEVTVLFGPTQCGKTTTFNLLTGKLDQQTGDGSGESVTFNPTLESSKVGPALDTPGMDDTRLRFTDEEAAMKVALAVVEAKATKVKFIVFVSLANDSLTLRPTLTKLEMAFGQSCLPATLVLMTKPDKATDDERKLREARVKDICKAFEVKEYLTWQNLNINEVDFQQQLHALQEALKRLPGITTSQIEDLETRIAKLAKTLCDAAPPVKKDIQESYTETTYVDEPYPEHYTEMVDKTTTEQVPVSYQVREGVNPVQQFFSLGTAGHGELVNKTRIETLTKTEKVPVQKTRMVPKRVAKPVTKERTKTVETRLGLEHFMSKAREQVLKEARERFVQKA